MVTGLESRKQMMEVFLLLSLQLVSKVHYYCAQLLLEYVLQENSKRFQTGVTMEISRLDAWFSDIEGSLESPATYIVKGLRRRCCLPEIILRCMQVSASLAESGESPDHRNELIELVASVQSGMLQLFSQHQLQEFLLFERECTLYTTEFQDESSMVDA